MRYALIFCSFLLFYSTANADALQKAENMLQEGWNTYNVSKLNKAIALATGARDASVNDVSVLIAKAYMRKAEALLYNGKPTLAAEELRRGKRPLSSILRVYSHENEVRQWRFFQGMLAQIIEPDAKLDEDTVFKNDMLYTRLNAPKSSAIMRMATAYGKTFGIAPYKENHEEGMFAYRKLMKDFPNTTDYKLYYWYAMAKHDDTQKKKNIKKLDAYAKNHHKHLLAMHLHAKLTEPDEE